jgi:UDP-N-acetylmuramate dehydrogenase
LDIGIESARPQRDVIMASLTTLGLGGPAASVFELTDVEQLAELVRGSVLEQPGIVPIPVGGGSNVLVADDGVAALVLLMRTRGVRYLPCGDDGGRVRVTVQAGHSWSELVAELAAEGLAGMETMVGIPGTVGAMPVQNVGAYGQETADVLVGVQAWDWHRREVVEFDAAGCRFGHRTSRFKATRRWLILDVTFELVRSRLSAPVTYRQVAEALGVPLGVCCPIGALMSAVRGVRAAKGMLLEDAAENSRTVGSVFLSPRIGADMARRLRAQAAPVHDFPDGSTRVSASWLMRTAGYELGQQITAGVRVSTRHYTLVADDTATTAAFVDAAGQVQEQVLEATGVLLSPEPDPLGDLPGYRKLMDRAGAGR